VLRGLNPFVYLFVAVPIMQSRTRVSQTHTGTQYVSDVSPIPLVQEWRASRSHLWPLHTLMEAASVAAMRDSAAWVTVVFVMMAQQSDSAIQSHGQMIGLKSVPLATRPCHWIPMAPLSTHDQQPLLSPSDADLQGNYTDVDAAALRPAKRVRLVSLDAVRGVCM
jgi:hypothetical protein